MSRKKKPQINAEALLLEASCFYLSMLEAFIPTPEKRGYDDRMLVAKSGVRGLIGGLNDAAIAERLTRRAEQETRPAKIQIVEAERPE